jgi:hypothetical protein
MLAVMGIPKAMLPSICPSSSVYGHAKGALEGIPVAGDLGDQQAALFGQTCFSPGEAKNTYGTGCFMLLNTGTKPVQSKNGLLTTLGYKIGDQEAVYCLEGSIAITGALIQWLRDNLKMIEKSPDVEPLARTVDDNGGIYFVPAFSGLFAPYWKSDARGAIVGMTRYVNRGTDFPEDAASGRRRQDAGQPGGGEIVEIGNRRSLGPCDDPAGRPEGESGETGRVFALLASDDEVVESELPLATDHRVEFPFGQYSLRVGRRLGAAGKQEEPRPSSAQAAAEVEGALAVPEIDGEGDHVGVAGKDRRQQPFIVFAREEVEQPGLLPQSLRQRGGEAGRRQRDSLGRRANVEGGKDDVHQQLNRSSPPAAHHPSGPNWWRCRGG